MRIGLEHFESKLNKNLELDELEFKTKSKSKH